MKFEKQKYNYWIHIIIVQFFANTILLGLTFLYPSFYTLAFKTLVPIPVYCCFITIFVCFTFFSCNEKREWNIFIETW